MQPSKYIYYTAYIKHGSQNSLLQGQGGKFTVSYSGSCYVLYISSDTLICVVWE